MTDKRDDMIDSVQLPDGSYLDVNENSEVVPESDDYNFDFRDVYDDSNRPLEEGQSRQDHRAPTNSERVWETDEQQIAIEPGRIGLWGTISSGKTTFLAILYHVMNKNGWRIYGTGEDSNSFIVSSYEMVFEDRNFPPPTIEDEVTIYEYELYYDPEDDVEVPQSRNPLLWRRSSRSKPQPKRKFSSEPKDFKLTFIDASGEAFRDPKRWRADNPGILHPFYELRRCEKIICLFDAEPFLPTRRPLESHGKPIRPIEYFKNAIQLFSLLRQNDSNLSRGRIHSYEFAFCISNSIVVF
ncbi:hypothetical protein KFU94_46525 [Chloroflexi bacterium TSY]|nr:hypothetical protein [Chloroflexi bacterium TSY]